MDFSPEGLRHSSGKHESFEEPALHASEQIKLGEFGGFIKAQMLLAPIAFPDAKSPMDLWVEEDQAGDSLASRFRAWVEDPARTQDDTQFHVSDRARLLELLDLVKKHPPESVH